MGVEKNLQKRIKRHISGRVRDYFAVTAPGMEILCLHELLELPLSVKEATAEKGGVAFKGRLHDCCLANLYLRTAGRILLRVSDFTATNFRQLGKKFGDIPWELFLYDGTKSVISVTSHHSRLYHKTAVAECLQAGLQKRLEQEGIPNSNAFQISVKQQILIRIIEDRVFVSLDSSGDNLYKRGLKTHGGRAPVRETTAAAVLLLAGYRPDQCLADPMCGSGTFALEGAMMINNIPPGWLREFSFFAWPAFRPKRWAYIKSQAQPRFRQPEAPLIFCADREPDACRLLSDCIREHHLEKTIQVACRDFFSSGRMRTAHGPGFITLNPPYGRRIDSGASSRKLFDAICVKLEQDYKGWKLALLVPGSDLAARLPLKLHCRRIHHGGLDAVLMTGII